MELWGKWLTLVNQFGEACSRKKTFFWLVVVLIGFTIQEKTQRGRPKKYGSKIKVFDLFKTELPFIKAPIPGNANLMIEYYQIQLLWKPLGRLAQFVLTRHPTRGNVQLRCQRI